MKMHTDKDMVVYNGKLTSFATILADEYEVEKIDPLDYWVEDYFAQTHQICIVLLWIKIKGTPFITAFSRKKIPEGITFTE